MTERSNAPGNSSGWGLSAAAGPVILDLQALQSRDYAERGVARHTFEFARALCEQRPDLVGAILLNPDLPIPIGPAGFEPLVATGKLGIAGEVDVSAGRIHHVIAPFELEVPLERVWPPFAVDHAMALVVTLHDLIPRVFPEHYHSDPGLRRRYLAREELIRAADRVLSVSGATRDEAIVRLGINPRRISVIGAGISEQFRPPRSRSEALEQAQAGVDGLEAGFVLYVGGIDHRKNIDGLLAAYAQLPPALRARHQLVVACRLSPQRRAHLEAAAARLGIGPRLLLTGYVDDAALIALYQSTDLFVFPSLYEGYGLPVVEAMACGAPVISSNTSALAELAHPAGHFDPADADAMAAMLGAALSDAGLRGILTKASGQPPPTWHQAVSRAALVYEELLVAPAPPRRRRLRVGFVTPLPPQPSGVAVYSDRLAEALIERHGARCELDIFVDDLEGGSLGLAHLPTAAPGVAVYPVEQLDRVEAARGGYDAMVYAIGNSEYHTGALSAARQRPGIVLAHDVRLPQLYAFAAHHGVLPPGFATVFTAMYPDAATPPDPLLIHPAELNALAQPMARELIGASRRFLTTSSFAAGLARLDAPDGDGARIAVLTHACRVVDPRPEPAAGAPEVVASFGVVNKAKDAGRLIEAFALVVDARPQARLVFVGHCSAADRAAIAAAARRLGVGDAVSATGAVSPHGWDGWLRRATLAVQLRRATNGEFSGAVAECLAFGVPTIVADLGFVADLPAGAVVRVPPLIDPQVLAAEISALLGDAGRRGALAAAARSYAATHSFPAVADQLWGWLLQDASVGSGVPTSVLDPRIGGSAPPRESR